MKKKLMAMLAVALVSTAWAGEEVDYSRFGKFGKWIADFEALAKSKGLEAYQCTSYTFDGPRHPERLKEYYNKGITPSKAFDEMGCDIEVFERVWMKELRRLAKAKGITVPAFDEEGGEALDEYLWLQFFTEGRSPQTAIPYLDSK